MTFAMTLGDVVSNYTVPMTLLRRTGGDIVVNGRVEPSPVTATTVAYGTHPAKGDVMQMLAEELRTKGLQWFYSTTELRTAKDPDGAGHLPDIVVYGGRYYEIHHVEDWKEGGFYRALGVLLNRNAAMAMLYFGSVAVPASVDATFVQALPGLLPQARRQCFLDVAVPGGQSLYFAAPTAFGAPTFSVSMPLVATNVTISGVPYSVYKSSDGIGSVVVGVS